MKTHFATAARALGAGAAMLALTLLSGCKYEILDPKGDIGVAEKHLLLTAFGLMMLVIVPVIIMVITFAWRYRASNTSAVYAPRWAHSTKIEVVCWGIPIIIVSILAVLAWKTSHDLDPYKPLESDVKPIEIDVVALDWKWLFIYPEQNIATVNEIAFPINTPVNFRITSASVMNAFFIPQLGSQIYAMAGMKTQLHLIAREEGDYRGMSANFSGPGFSGMHFQAIATSAQGFDDWVKKVQSSGNALTADGYTELAKPSERVAPTYFSGAPAGMFDLVLQRTMSKIAGVDDGICTPTSKNLVAISE